MAVVNDRDVTCLDAFSFAHIDQADGADVTGLGLESFCTIPSGAHYIGNRRAFVTLVPGIEALDLYSASVWREIWKDGCAVECWVPKALIGWEFYSLLYPQPDCASTLRLNGAIELLIGRPPGKEVCPSILFAYVPGGYVHMAPVAPASFSSAAPQSSAASRGMRPGFASVPPPSTMKSNGRTVQTVERQQGNLDNGGRAVYARLVVLCPTSVFKDSASIPPEVTWGLFVSPRSRTMILVNRERGRIDLQLACLLTHDAVFRFCSGLTTAFGRLFEPLGTAHVVPNCFRDADPLQIHCGITNALVVDHADIEADGREDYRTHFGVRLPEFFLSNSSANLCFLVPAEAQKHRAGIRCIDLNALREGLPNMPMWTLEGVFDEDTMRSLVHYRERSRPPPAADITSVKGGLLHFLGIDSASIWLKAFSGCSDMTIAPKALSSAQPALPAGEQGPQIRTAYASQVSQEDPSSHPVITPNNGTASSNVDGGSGAACGLGMSLEKQTTQYPSRAAYPEPSFPRQSSDALSQMSHTTRMPVGTNRGGWPSAHKP